MIEVKGLLNKTGQVTLNGSGSGTIDLDPDNANQRWEITRIVVSTSQALTAVPVPSVELFAGPQTSPANSRGASYNGNQVTFTGLIDLGAADELHVVFTGGIPGTMGFARLSGSKYTRRG